MLDFRDDAFREFLVHTSIHDNAPQKLRLKVQDPLSAEDMLQQIARLLIEPTTSISPEGPTRMPILLDSSLLAFSAEENCFVPVDGKPADMLKVFAHLLVHKFSAVPSLVPNAAVSWRSSFNSGIPSVSAQDGAASLEGPLPKGGCLFTRTPPSAGTRRNEPLGHTSRLSPHRTDELPSQTGDLMDGLGEYRKRRRLPLTLECMLEVVEYLLSEYSARAADDVIEPTEKSVWNLVEDISGRSGGVSTRSLDPVTVNAFVETILCSINTGRIRRTSHRSIPL
ncbi:hypothetical protein TraAM80_07796 [Trypanosoma rangeli]|uniref:Uncharacterized protein n=1 Tax=Trypanosoma rangeli TaxID=5698 RepID=A0A422N3Q6_TRYRA|nr:uncharacterized protein TraAM80_07796 [Trypanosoma rangeli]RNF00113.1 hypothetical protein TraAM80_07796 [Trypanosoma rangeli]|eukprot:RNF00113.1 hypothetical protein TraAM80_07796 [Trypanosoma rangeli]